MARIVARGNESATRSPNRSRSAVEVMTNTAPRAGTSKPMRSIRSRPTKTGYEALA
jgi:hypothetical protein